MRSVFAIDDGNTNIRNPDSIRNMYPEAKSSVIANTTGYATANKAESESDRAMYVSGIALGIRVEEAKRIGVLFVHYSMDNRPLSSMSSEDKIKRKVDN